MSDCPEVHSNGYHIRFDAKSGPIGYILPQWIEEQRCEDGLEGTREVDGDDELDPLKTEYDR